MGDETEEGMSEDEGMTSDVETVEPGEGGESGEGGEVLEGGEVVEGGEAGGSAAPMGEEPAWGEDSTGGTDYTPATAEVGGIETLNFEVTVLTIASVDRVADEIARRIQTIAADRKLKGVVISDPGAIALLRAHATLMSQLAALELQVDAAKIPNEDEGGMESGFIDLAATIAGARKVREVANNVGKLLSVFEVSSTYQGKQVRLVPSVLPAALAKHIAGRGVVAQVPRYAVRLDKGSEFVNRLVALQRRCQALIAADSTSSELGELSGRITGLVAAVFGTSGGGDSIAAGSAPPLVQQLAEAEMLSAAIGDGFALLTVEMAAAGGSYRMRKWIFNGLLGRDSLTYSGGAAVTFFLLAGDSMASLASDTIYFATGHGSFGDKYQRFSPTNIPGLERY